MNHFQIAPECYADTLLVEMLGFRRPNHQLGIGKVIGLFEKSLQKRQAVGIIDDDKLKPKDLDQFEIQDEQHGIRRLVKGNHSVLIICPGFEKWVFENARLGGVDPSKYGFSNSKTFGNACKRMDVSQNQSVKQFLNTLNQKKVPGFVLLKKWICETVGIDETSL